MFYELINPSDKITFRARDFESAVGATLALGRGRYGAKRIGDDGWGTEDESMDVPLFLFGGAAEWLAKKGLDLDKIIDGNRDGVVAALRDFAIGDMKDRKLYESALEKITDDAKRREFIAEWDDERRTSLSEIVNQAHILADAIEEDKPVEEDRTVGPIVLAKA